MGNGTNPTSIGEIELPASASSTSEPEQSASSVPEEGAASGSGDGQEAPASSQAEESGSTPASETEEVSASSVAPDPIEEAQQTSAFSSWTIAGFLLGIVCALLALWLWKKSHQKGTAAEEMPEEPPAKRNDANAPLTFEVGKLHEQGARDSQQDCFSVSDPQGLDTYGVLAVVADGMGGLANGDRVSQCAVSAMMEGFYRTEGDAQSVLLMLAERAVAAVNAELGFEGLNQSGSTLVAGIVKDRRFCYLSVGDSRICLYRDGALFQLNRDHILRRELEVQAINGEISWEAAAANPKAQGLTSYLGMGALKYVDIPSRPLALRHGDRLILMSDGVYNALTEEELCAELDKPAQAAADAIGAKVAAKNYEQQDNYTAIILAF